ncbi:MAG: translation elongation factor 4 [Patescibacteria group bacterium]
MDNIRNFAIISHVDHGKSTLADRFLELTNTVELRKMRAQFLDSMDLEREKGITIKLKPVKMKYFLNGVEYIFNLIDTPGHVDFSYEVSRSLAACEGAILLVDATQGIQAQTLSNYNKARALNLKIIPAVNKIDSPVALVSETRDSIKALFGFNDEEIFNISGKTGENVAKLLEEVALKIPAPTICTEKPFRALIFDSFYDSHLGVVAVIKAVDGEIEMDKADKKIRFIHSKKESSFSKLGYFAPQMRDVSKISSGDVGFIATGLKDITLARVGDTVAIQSECEVSEVSPLYGYRLPKPVVFLSLFPEDSSDLDNLRKSLFKLKLNDAALSFSVENASSLGLGFRCGFLGLLHAEITQERLEREFNARVFATTPSVSYKVLLNNGLEITVTSAGDFPDPSKIKSVLEPYTSVYVFAPFSYVGSIMELVDKKRGKFLDMKNIGEGKQMGVQLLCELPLYELITGFYDDLKSISSGYASMDYELIKEKPAKVLCMDILIAGEKISPLSRLVREESATAIGREIVKKLKESLPRQQFVVSIQAAIGGRIIARENLSAMRKNVLEGIYGGHRERKDKLLDRQKRGKKRLKRFGKVVIPQEVFW